MKFHHLGVVAVCATMLLLSCQKDSSHSRTEGLTPTNQSFSYSAENLTHFKIAVNGVMSDDIARLDVYSDIRKLGQKVMVSRFIKSGEPLSFKANVPSYLDQVYLAVTDGQGRTFVEKAAIREGKVIATFQMQSAKPALKASLAIDCSSGCDVTYTSMSKNLTLKNAKVYCFDGVMDNKHITAKSGAGATIRICGTGSYKNVNIGAGNTLQIAAGAMVDFAQLNVDNGATVMIGEAVVNVNGTLDINGLASSAGEINVSNQFNINGQGVFVNHGDVMVGGNFNNNNELENYDSIYVDGHIHFNGSSKTLNYCYIYTDDHLQFNHDCDNHGYIGASKFIHFNGGSTTNQINGAIIEGKANCHVNSVVSGLGSTSLISIATTTNVGGAGVLQGNLAYCDGDGVIEVNNGTLSAPATFTCNVFIAPTACNPGFGTPGCPDGDGDGVCDSTDKFPNDPNLAGCDCYPNCQQFATLAFEDLWPFAGDYDFNDLVMDYRYTMFTNANNEVLKMEAEYFIRAIGAKNVNGFGLQLEASPTAISSVVGQLASLGYIINESNGTESGQSKATIVFFESNQNAFDPGANITGFINTIPSDPYREPDTIRIWVHFNGPQPIASLGVAPFNPFMIANSNRDKEIHLKDYPPTDLADVGRFGTGDDLSDPINGIYYTGAGGIPWVLNFPESFDYPAEYHDIRDAYHHFADWAASGGVLYPDWYFNVSVGYRDNSKIY